MQKKRFRSAVIGCGAALVLAGSANANPVAVNWSGFYLGTHVGFANGDLRGHYNESADDFARDFRSTGGIYGLQGGYNWQFGRRVYGVEIDVTGADISDTFPQGTIGAPSTATFRTSFLASARFRSGIAVDNVLFFSSIGVGLGNSRLSVVDPNTTSFSRNFNDAAIVSGFGVEWRFSPHWSLRGEYLYYYFGDRRGLADATAASDDFDFFKLNGIQTIRLAVNYHFNAARPVIAAPAMNWSGWYAGVHLGYGRSELPGMYDEAGDVGALNIDPRGFAGGLYTGFNWQRGAWVYGFELDGTWAGLSNDRIDDEDDFQRLRTTAFGSFRGRIGVATDNKLFYLTGGIGAVRSSIFADEGAGDTGLRRFTSWGPVIGAGLECAWRGNWSVRLEGMTYLLDNRIGLPDLTSDSEDQDYVRQRNLYVVRAGLTYRFGGPQ
jgi:outer membrane immunogenic protein